MKTILALTDLSAYSTHAAEYAYKLAQNIKTDLMLCNAFMVPATAPEAGMMGWPTDAYAMLSEESETELDILERHLESFGYHSQPASVFAPKLSVVSETGNICDVITRIDPKRNIQLIVAGTHHKSILSDMLLGNSMNSLINDIDFPLLLIPPKAAFKPIKKILFASDLEFAGSDTAALEKLIKLVSPMETRITLTHVCKEKSDNDEKIRNILRAIADKIKYEHINYNFIHQSDTEKGLHRLCEKEDADILVMVHHNHSLLERVFTTSHSQKMARQTLIPLLVMPAN